jgi:hypothetical protein
LFITFDGLNRFFRMIACFKGHSMSVHPAFLEIWNSTLLKIFEWSKFSQISKCNFSRISRRIFLKILWWQLTLVLNIISKNWDGVLS